jgi:hypothetical protein
MSNTSSLVVDSSSSLLNVPVGEPLAQSAAQSAAQVGVNEQPHLHNLAISPQP